MVSRSAGGRQGRGEAVTTKGDAERHLAIDSLQDYLQAGAPAIVPIVGEPPAALVIEPSRNRIAVRLPWDGVTPPDLTRYENLATDVLSERGMSWVEIRVQEEGLLYDAYPMLCAIADRVQIDGLTFGQAVREVLATYHDLLARRFGLGDERELGLYGELLLLEHLMLRFGPLQSVTAWRGPYGEEHDFSLEEQDVEVKTTSTDRRVHWIGALEQLTPSPMRALWLISIQLTTAGDGPGRSLSDLVEAVRTDLTEEASHLFENALISFGWRSHEIALYQRRFRLRSQPLVLRVDSDFPSGDLERSPEGWRTGGALARSPVSHRPFRPPIECDNPINSSILWGRGGSVVTDVLSESYIAAIKAMQDGAPRALMPRAALEAEDRDPTADVGWKRLIDHLRLSSPNDALRKVLHLALAHWDDETSSSPWSAGSEPSTTMRRTVVYDGLQLDSDVRVVLDELMPVMTDETVVISDEFVPWYPPATLQAQEHYWPHYKQHLTDTRGWSVDAVARLDSASQKVVERLSNPIRPEAYQSKGLVVGYVQSGKTANFTGVIAKTIDAGYRLVIVLTGTSISFAAKLSGAWIWSLSARRTCFEESTRATRRASLIIVMTRIGTEEGSQPTVFSRPSADIQTS